MSNFQPTAIREFPKKKQNVLTLSETNYWKKLRSPVSIVESASIYALHFSPAFPHDLAVCSGSRVQIYNSKTATVKKTIARFKETVYCASFRNDGKLLVCGDGSGLVQVFDTNSRVILRTLRGHNTVVKAAMFVPHQPTSVITASHDKTVRVWDLPTESTTFTYDGHGDYVQCVDVFKQHSHLMVTGSYDHTLRLFDTRASTEPVHAIHLDHPIDACVAFPGSNLVAVANGPQVDMVDFASTSASRVQLANHQKSVLTLAMDTEAGYLLTGGLDQMVKVYNTSTWKVVHSVPCDAAAFAVALSPDDTRLAIGMAGGLVSIRRRRNVEPTAAQQAKRLAADPIGILTGQRLVRLSEAKALERAPNDDATVYTVPRNKSKRLGDYDKLLKSFQYAKALDAVLARHSPAVVVAVVHELHYRGGLRQAIARRTEDTLAPILKFILSNIHQPKYTSILIQVAEMVLDTYRHVAITSTATTASLVKLQRILWQEIKQQNQLSELKGMVEMVMTMNALAL